MYNCEGFAGIKTRFNTETLGSIHYVITLTVFSPKNAVAVVCLLIFKRYDKKHKYLITLNRINCTKRFETQGAHGCLRGRVG